MSVPLATGVASRAGDRDKKQARRAARSHQALLPDDRGVHQVPHAAARQGALLHGRRAAHLLHRALLREDVLVWQLGRDERLFARARRGRRAAHVPGAPTLATRASLPRVRLLPPSWERRLVAPQDGSLSGRSLAGGSPRAAPAPGPASPNLPRTLRRAWWGRAPKEARTDAVCAYGLRRWWRRSPGQTTVRLAACGQPRTSSTSARRWISARPTPPAGRAHETRADAEGALCVCVPPVAVPRFRRRAVCAAVVSRSGGRCVCRCRRCPNSEVSASGERSEPSGESPDGQGFTGRGGTSSRGRRGRRAFYSCKSRLRHTL